METRLSGNVVMPIIDEKSDSIETLKKIELMNISNDEKDMLFIVTQKAYTNEKKELIKNLERIIQMGIIYPLMTSSKVIEDKGNKINKKEKEEIINIAENLKRRIENDEIVLWGNNEFDFIHNKSM